MPGGGLSTKIHAMVDALGNPAGFHLTSGQAHDLDGTDFLLKGTGALRGAPGGGRGVCHLCFSDAKPERCGATGAYERKLANLAKVPLLIIDDFGLKPLRAPFDEDLHDLISERYERTTTVVTSNLDY